MGNRNELYLSQQELLRQMEYTGGGEDGVAIWYLGQEGFLLKRNGQTIAIDPYLTDSVDQLPEFPQGFWQRRYPAPLNPHDLRGVDLVLCTHEHLDHLDPMSIGAIAQASPSCKIAAPSSCRPSLISAGIAEERILNMIASQSYTLPSANGGQVVIHPIPAAHESYEKDEDGYDLYLGYVIEWDGLCLYHAGDTLVTEQLISTLKPYRIDVGFVPINGRDIFRNRDDVVGNMNAQEAIEFAAELQFDVMVPMHYDLYLNNGGSPAFFVDYLFHHHLGQKYKLFQPGERWIYPKLDRIRPVAVIVGAGKTGRGFIARLLAYSPYRIVFIDISVALVNKINEDQSYSIHYFNQDQRPVHIHGVMAHLLSTTEAIREMAGAEIMFTAVGEQNLPALAQFIIQAKLLRQQQQIDSPLQILTCENGVAPGDVLRKALHEAGGSGGGEMAGSAITLSGITISESAIFCSTVELQGTRLDIISEAYHELPYDAQHLFEFKKIPAMVPIGDFKKLLQRKIYTYNCISAAITYLGAFKGYRMYAEAANDTDIRHVLERLVEPLNHAICLKLNVDTEEQSKFAARAIAKFSDRNISDNIARNARDVARKLGPNERMIAPARMIIETGGDAAMLALVIAAALHYDAQTESVLREEIRQQGVIPTFLRISGLSAGHELVSKVEHDYRLLEQTKAQNNISFTNWI